VFKKSVRFAVISMFAVLGVSAQAVAQTLPAGWSTRDIGSTGATGSASTVAAGMVLTGAGLDVWGTTDQFRFAYTTLTGDGAIVAQVATLDDVNAWTKAGVMMRETLTGGSKHAFMLVSPGKGLAFQRRPSTGGSSVHTTGGSGMAPYWVKIARKGSVFTASRSLDGVTWTTVGTQTMTMTATIYVGVAVSSHVTGDLATARFDHVDIATATTTSVPPPPTAPAARLRLLQWNVAHGGTRTDGVYDPQNTVNWIVKMNPDVASLNEFDNATQAATIHRLLETKTGLNWEYHYDRGNMVITKLPVTDRDVCIVNAAVGRKSTFLGILLNGKPVSVYSAHLSLTDSERLVEIPALQACASNKVESRILAGDFNMQATSTSYAKAIVGHTDAWKAAKSAGTAVNYPGNCDGCTKNSRIDYVFTSQGAALVVKGAEVVDTRNSAGVAASDHKPMVVTYDVK
jgi:endonuclease/exonuclease/phosphatase family metal-dependent hydrolase